jgi:hypothetical protein
MIALHGIERSARNGLGADFILARADQNHDRHMRRLRLEAQEGRQAVAVGQRQFQQDRVDAAELDAAERFRERRHHLEPVWLPADRSQRVRQVRLVGRQVADEQDRGSRHKVPSIRRSREPDL